MRRLLAALALSLLAFAAPAWADHRQAETERLVRWAGCHAPVHTSDQVSVLASFYSPDGGLYYEPGLYIGTAAGVPGFVRLMVTLHETGHCLQHQEGAMDAFTNMVDLELDADRRAADLACGLGLDGRALLHDLFVWAYRVFGYTGDWLHGTLAQRIEQGERASRCGVRPVEAP